MSSILSSGPFLLVETLEQYNHLNLTIVYSLIIKILDMHKSHTTENAQWVIIKQKKISNYLEHVVVVVVVLIIQDSRKTEIKRKWIII